MAKASAADSIVSALNKLRRELEDPVVPTVLPQVNPTNCTSHCTLLLSGFRRLFVQQDYLATYDNAVEESLEQQDWSFILRSHIDSLKREYGFLRTFLKYIYEWTDATVGDLEESLGSLNAKIKVVINEIALTLGIAAENMYVSTRPSKLIDVLCDSLEKIESFKPEIQQALTDCCFRSSPIKSLHPLPNYLSWISFVESIEENLEVVSARFVDHVSDSNLAQQILVCKNKLTSLRSSFLNHVAASLEYMFGTDQRIKDFFNHVASIAVKIANQCCVYWFNKKDDPSCSIVGILDLQEEIDLISSPKFLELNLKFLRALRETRFLQVQTKASLFLDYLLGEPRGDNHHWGLRTLIAKVISRQEEDLVEDEKNLFEDIMAVLREALPLRDVLRVRSLIPHIAYQLYKSKLWHLEQKIWLLKTEIFLKEQIHSSPVFLPNIAGIIESQNKGLKKLKRFCKSLPEEELEGGNEILTIMEVVVTEVASLCQSYQAQKITQFKVKRALSRLVLKILLFKAGSSLMELMKCNASFMAFGKNQFETVEEGLKLFTLLVTIYVVDIEDDVELIVSHIEVVVREILSIHHTFLGSKLTEEIIQEMIISFSNLLGKVKLIKKELGEICPRFPRSNVPKTDGLGFIDFFLVNLEELLKHDPDSIAPVKYYIIEIRLDLQWLRSFLMQLDSEHPKLKDIGTSVVDIAYEVEYVIDAIEVGMSTNWKHCLCLYYLLEEIRLTRKLATQIYEESTCDATVQNLAQISSHIRPVASRYKSDEVLVSLTDQEQVIIDRLTRGSSQRDIIPIVGMPGIGKTTLANKVYKDPNVMYRFHFRAWCSVSQEYEKRELLLEILRNISGLTDSIHQLADEDLELKLYQHLKQKRYLIVMDDVWNIRAWKDLESSFPDDGNGSRILITSRLHDVATKAKSGSVPHPLRLLSIDESWKLLQMKVFPGGVCPEELLEVGKKIAQNCKGLPLAVVAIAGLLERIEKKQDRWEKIVESLSSLIIDDPETRCKEILQLSYKQLPDHLKTCFLYFGAFLEDRDILVSKLSWLWIAEGLIQRSESKSFEDVAQDYFLELIDRSLVIISKRSCNGNVKACRVHDMLRDLCLSKAKEDKFFQLITKYDEPYASFNDLDYGDDFGDLFPSNPVTYEAHRLCISLKRKHFFMSRPAGLQTRSLIFFATNDTYPRCPYDISFISDHFKLLRVLDFECVNIGIQFPVGVELLVQLRYLAISGDLDTVPPSMANLWKLETFLVKGLKGKVVLPYTIWQMARLRHVHVNNHVAFSLQNDRLRHLSKLENLITLSSPSLSYGKDTERIISCLPNLKKLRCRFSESMDPSKKCNQFPRLASLTQLESLRIFYSGKAVNAAEFNFPTNLKKLTLLNFRLPWDHISFIGRLQNLEVLKILSRAFEGQRWDMMKGEFLKLKFLKLDNLNICQWNADSDHLPNLRHLLVRSCKNLEEVPLAFAEIPTLEKIEVQWCSQSTEESVRKIEEEEVEGLKILVNHSDSFI